MCDLCHILRKPRSYEIFCAHLGHAQKSDRITYHTCKAILSDIPTLLKDRSASEGPDVRLFITLPGLSEIPKYANFAYYAPGWEECGGGVTTYQNILHTSSPNTLER